MRPLDEMPQVFGQVAQLLGASEAAVSDAEKKAE